MDKRYKENAAYFKALADAKRLMIVDMLSSSELRAYEILKEFKITQPALSYHIRTLCESGLVKGRKVGMWTRYSLDEEAVQRCMDFMNTITSSKEDCTCNDGDCGCDSGCGCNNTESSNESSMKSVHGSCQSAKDDSCGCGCEEVTKKGEKKKKHL